MMVVMPVFGGWKGQNAGRLAFPRPSFPLWWWMAVDLGAKSGKCSAISNRRQRTAFMNDRERQAKRARNGSGSGRKRHLVPLPTAVPRCRMLTGKQKNLKVLGLQLQATQPLFTASEAAGVGVSEWRIVRPGHHRWCTRRRLIWISRALLRERKVSTQSRRVRSFSQFVT